MSLKALTLVLTAITRLPGLLRWIGELFSKSLIDRLEEVKKAEKELVDAKTVEQEDEAIKKIRSNLHSSDH
jgi:hypothetical protein